MLIKLRKENNKTNILICEYCYTIHFNSCNIYTRGKWPAICFRFQQIEKMKSYISVIQFIFLLVLISCNGGESSTPVGVEDTTATHHDTDKVRVDKKIDTSAAALPTDTAVYKRKDSSR